MSNDILIVEHPSFAHRGEAGCIFVAAEWEAVRRTPWSRFVADDLAAGSNRLVIANAVASTEEATRFFERLRGHPSATPILAIIPECNDALLQLAAETAADFLIWPARVEELRRRITRLLGSYSHDLADAQALLSAEIGLRQLVGEDPAAAWDKIKKYAGNLKDMAMNAIMDYIVVEVVKKATTKIASMFIPGAAFISAIISIYDTIVVFIRQLSKIIQIASAFLDSMMEIAAVAIGAAANKVESTLEDLLTLAINFLADFLGPGKIAAKVMDIINTRIRAPIDAALDKVVAWIAAGAKKLYTSAKAGVAKLFLWGKQRLAINAVGEAHTLYFAGDGPGARLTVASEPKDIRAFLAERSKESAKHPKKAEALASIVAHIARIDLLSKLTDDQQQARESEFKAFFNAIGQLLVVLLSDSDWDTQENPVPLEYTKRRAGAYRTLYIGPKSEEYIPQTLLESKAVPSIKKILTAKEARAWEARNYLIVKCPPLSKTQLPDGGPTIGLDEQYQIGVGKKVPYQPGKTSGGGLINRTLKPYGYRATAEGMDGDHIVEMQIGGPNVLENLWPLDKGENRLSGALLSDAR